MKILFLAAVSVLGWVTLTPSQKESKRAVSGGEIPPDRSRRYHVAVDASNLPDVIFKAIEKNRPPRTEED